MIAAGGGGCSFLFVGLGCCLSFGVVCHLMVLGGCCNGLLLCGMRLLMLSVVAGCDRR